LQAPACAAMSGMQAATLHGRDVLQAEFLKTRRIDQGRAPLTITAAIPIDPVPGGARGGVFA